MHIFSGQKNRVIIMSYCICSCHQSTTAINSFCVYCTCGSPHQASQTLKCNCECHSISGISHIVPCCYPQKTKMTFVINTKISTHQPDNEDFCTGCARQKEECSCDIDEARPARTSLRCSSFDD